MIEKPIGSAATEAEELLEIAISRVPEWRGKMFTYAPMLGGLLNQSWRVSIDGESKRFFVKVPGKGSDCYINRSNSNVAARHASAIGIAPKVVYFEPESGIEISEFLEGYRACTNADFCKPELQVQALGLYKMFNAGPQLPVTKTIFDMIEEHIAQARGLRSQLPFDFNWLERRFFEAKAAVLASGLDLVPCFNDPIPGNFLINDQRSMKLVDFEFASNNERAYELGSFVGEMFLTEKRTLELVEEYYGQASPENFARVTVLRALSDIKWGAWGIMNRMYSNADFDYQKYGQWTFIRARFLLLDPRWESWLGAI